MLATDRMLRVLLKRGDLQVDPEPTEDLIQPSSLDVHLHRYFRRFTRRVDCIDFAEEQPELTEPVEIPDGEPFILNAGEFALGSTLQKVALSESLAAQIDGRSSMGRGGLLVHATAGFIDPWFDGHITLELRNLTQLPMKLWPGMKLAQLIVFVLAEPVERGYGAVGRNSSYQHQGADPQPSGAWRNWIVLPTRTERPAA